MKKNNITSNLTFWVLLSIVIGVIVGHFRPDIALYPVFEKKINYSLLGTEISFGPSLSEMFSGIFISLVKLFIHPIIFLTISLGIVNMGNLKKVGVDVPAFPTKTRYMTKVSAIIQLMKANN
jgi:aerobic C4-dicarboxylate transport protein